MKKQGFIFLVIILCTGIFSTSAQTFGGETTNDEEIEAQVENQTISPDQFLSVLGVDNSPNPALQNIQGNAVFLTQIGELNSINVGVRANASEINVAQEGNENFSFLNYNVDTAFVDLLQNGNRNQVIDIVNDPTANVSLELEQRGDGLIFQREGTTRLIENLKFTQTAASPTIILRKVN